MIEKDENKTEKYIEDKFRQLGYILDKNKITGNWDIDFVLKTPEGASIFVEVKNHVGIPDILALASVIKQQNSNVQTTSGSISTYNASPVIKEIASKNFISIIEWNNEYNANIKYKFLQSFLDLEKILQKEYGINTKNKTDFKEKLLEKTNEENQIEYVKIKQEIDEVWEIRNRIVHNSNELNSEKIEAGVTIINNIKEKFIKK